MKTAVESTFTMSSGLAGAPGPVASIIAFARSNTANGLSVLNSPLYRTYCNLYDSVKCIGMKVLFSVVDSVGTSDLPSVQIYTAWDRQHLGNMDPAPQPEDLKNMSTYNVATALNNNVAKITRSLYASDLMEKAIWHDCTLTPDDASNPTYWDDNVYKNSANLSMFSPSLFLSLVTPTLAAGKTVNVTVSVVYYMAFRNPRFGGSGGFNTREDIIGERVRGLPSDGADGDMDDGGDLLMDDVSNAPDGAASASADPPPARKSVMSRAPSSSTAARVVQVRRQQQQRNLRAESLNE